MAVFFCLSSKRYFFKFSKTKQLTCTKKSTKKIVCQHSIQTLRTKNILIELRRKNRTLILIHSIGGQTENYIRPGHKYQDIWKNTINKQLSAHHILYNIMNYWLMLNLCNRYFCFMYSVPALCACTIVRVCVLVIMTIIISLTV